MREDNLCQHSSALGSLKIVDKLLDNFCFGSDEEGTFGEEGNEDVSLLAIFRSFKPSVLKEQSKRKLFKKEKKFKQKDVLCD